MLIVCSVRISFTEIAGFLFDISSYTYINYFGLRFCCCCCALWCLLWFWSRKWRYFSLWRNWIDRTLWMAISKGWINKFVRPMRGWMASRVEPHRESNTLIIACIVIYKYQSNYFTCGLHLTLYTSSSYKYPPITSLYASNVALRYL